MNLKKLSYSIYDKTETLGNDKSIDVVDGLIIPILADIKHNKNINGTNELLDIPTTDIIAENTLTQINDIKNNIPSSEFQHKQITNQIFTSYIPTSNTLTSFNGFNYYSSNQQHFNTIKYGIVSDIVTDDKGNNNLKDIIYETTGSITNIFFNYLSYDLIKKYGIFHAEIIANNDIGSNNNNNNNNNNKDTKQWIIANNSYQIFLICDNVIYDVVSISKFYYHKYSLNLNIMSNIGSNPKEVIYSLHYVDNKDVNNESTDLENISFFNIKDNKINFITDKIFTNTDNRNLLAFDTNGNIIYQYPDKLGLNSCDIDKLINITLIKNQQKINKVFMVNDLLFSIGNYSLSNNNQIIYGNKIKENMTYSIVKLNHNPDLFIPLNDSVNNILKVIYRSLSDDNTIHYYSYVVDNKFELIIDNTTYTKESNTITFDKSTTNYKLIEINGKVIIESNDINILELTPLSTNQSIVTIYDTTYGTIKLFTSNNRATLTVGYITITGAYDTNNNTIISLIDSQTKKYILTEENNNLKVNEAIYPFIKKMIITNKEFNDDTFIISYSIDSNNKGSIRCNRKTTEQIINNNLQDNILQITKDKVRFRVNKESVNKYKFNYANETVN